MSFIRVNSNFGEHLKHLRIKAGLTQEALAQQLHITRQAVSGWERGRNEPDVKTLLLLTQIFGITADELLAPGGEKEIIIHYRRGGFAMLPFVAIALLIAWLAGAPTPAICSIAGFGFLTSCILIALGNRLTKK